MTEMLVRLDWWHWWIAAAILAALETFMPGAVAIWFAIAAAVVGALLLVVPIPWPLQFILFGALGFVAVVLYRNYARRRGDGTPATTLNQRGLQYVGQEATLVEPLEAGNGKIRLGDTVWKVTGPTLPNGARVRVTGVEGAVLVVEAAP